jgi:hypothetical protein
MLAIGAAFSGMFVEPEPPAIADVEGLEAGFSESAAELSDASDFALGDAPGETDGLAFVFFEGECLEDDFRWLFGVGLGRSLASSVKVFFTLLLNLLSE